MEEKPAVADPATQLSHVPTPQYIHIPVPGPAAETVPATADVTGAASSPQWQVLPQELPSAGPAELYRTTPLHEEDPYGYEARNDHHKARTVVTAAGPVEVRAPRINDRHVDNETGERKRFSSKILPPWCRKSPKISEVLPLLYPLGLSSGGFIPALEQFLGGTAGLSPATVTRLTRQWSYDHASFQNRDLSDRDFVCMWADGVHPKVRLGQAHSCVLVLLGVRLDGTKELIALAEGLRKSTESWADLLRDCRRRGMRDPELVIADGVMGLWRALAEVFPAARPQRCWVHKARNVTHCLPKSAQARWLAITGAHLVPLVRAGARFEDGVLVKREEQAA